MRSSRLVLIVLSLALGLAVFAPAAALADGPSAGDQQYVDPLGGSSGQSNSGSHSSHSSGSSSSSASSGSTGTVSSGSSVPTAASATASTTAATAATPTATTTSDPTTTSRTLPFTGFNAWEGALIGVVLVGGGAILRRRVAPR